MYTLLINNGSFLVEKETKNVKDIDSSTSEPSAHERKQAHSVEFEFGLMNPAENDWADFKNLLRHSAETSKAASKYSRTAKIFDWLRRQ